MDQIHKQQQIEALSEVALSESKEISVRFALVKPTYKTRTPSCAGAPSGLEEKFKFVETVLKVAAKVREQ